MRQSRSSKAFFILILLLPILPSSIGTAKSRVHDGLDASFAPIGRKARILSLAPSATEIVFYLDAGNQLIGRTESCNFPSQAERVPSIKNPFDLNLEWVLRNRPDIVLMTTGAKVTKAKLERLKIPVFVIDIQTTDDIPKYLRIIGRLLDRLPFAEQKASSLEAKLEVWKRKVRVNQPRVYWEIWSKPIMSVGGSSFLDDAIRLAGGKNVFHDIKDPWPVIGEETVLRARPELIFTVDRKEFLNRRQNWLRAWGLSKSSVIQIEIADQIHRPTPRLIDGIEWIQNAIDQANQ